MTAMSRLNIKPKLTPSGATPLSALLYGSMKANGVRCYEIESKLGVSATTLRKWLKEPEQAGMDNVRKIAVIIGLSKTEVCNAWKW